MKYIKSFASQSEAENQTMPSPSVVVLDDTLDTLYVPFSDSADKVKLQKDGETGIKYETIKNAADA